MSGDIVTSNNTHVYIGHAVTTTQSDTLGEFQAMTGWDEIGLVQSIGAFGDKSNTVTFASLGDARMRKQKGVRDAGDMTITVAHDPNDSGQAAVETAEADDSAYAIKVVLPDSGNTVLYFRAFVMSVPIEIGASDNVIKKTYGFAIDSEIFTA